jgi:hypothetical protein
MGSFFRKGQIVIEIILQFLFQVAASTLGILIGAWLARSWEEAWRKIKQNRKR